MRKNPGRPGLQTAMSPGNKWHVLGAGAVGQLFAHHLRRAGAEVVLLLRTEAALRSFQDARQCIKVERQIATEAPESTACDGAASDRRPSPGEANPGPNTSGPPAATPGAQHIDRTCNQALDLRTETQVSSGYTSYVPVQSSCHPTAIDNLLITVKAHQTVEAVSTVSQRLWRGSNMVFLQNGMGTIEEVVKLFPGDDEELPCMIKGITNHGCKRSHMELFTVHHTSALGQGEVVFGVASARHGGRPSAVQALETLGQMSQLGARVVDADSILHIQRQKLLVNACINPLTALLGCTNGGLLMSQDAKRLMAQVCQEGANIFQASCATQASSLLSPQSAFQAALEVAKITSTNRSSMLQDIERGRQTEVAFINGFLVREAHRLGLGAPVNALLESLVSAKATLAASLLHSV